MKLPVALLALCAGASTALAQSADSVRLRDGFVATWAGASFSTTSLTTTGRSPRRNFYVVGFELGRTMHSTRRWALVHIVDLLPVALLSAAPPVEVSQPEAGSPGGAGFPRPARSHGPMTYGAGVTTGLRASLETPEATRIFASLSGGGALFERPVPGPGASRFTFAFNLAVGIDLDMGRHSAVTMGYKRHHMSNASLARRNPGLDGNMYYVGLARRTR